MRRWPQKTDWLVALVGAGLTEWAIWIGGSIGDPVAGHRWLVATLPLLLDLPLAWRRIAPLPMLVAMACGIVIQAVATSHSPEGLELIYAIGFAAYSAGAYAPRRDAILGLALLALTYGVYAPEDPNIRSGTADNLWAAAFFGVAILALWLVGVWVRSRRDAAELEREAGLAVTEERARMARELHDIVSHNLSVVVLQAAGARAAGASDGTLEKIERSGREALVEMRRLLGVLREDPGDGAALAPQPGISQLQSLVGSVRAAGLHVELAVDATCTALPPAVELAVYRIVQEALTNALKHAGPASVEVRVAHDGDAVRVDVVDDGPGAAGESGGHGLVGMRERVALFGGLLLAGPRPEGGFEVHATLPLAP